MPWRRAWQPTPGFLPGEFTWTEEPAGLQSLGSQRVRHDWSYITHSNSCPMAGVPSPWDLRPGELRWIWWYNNRNKVHNVLYWLSWLHAHEFVQTPGNSEGQGSLVSYSIWGCKESDMTERLNNSNSKSEVKVARSCPTLCDPMDSPWNSPAQNATHLSLLQGIFPTQGLQVDSFPAEPQGKPNYDRVLNKCNEIESSPTHPPHPWSVEKLSSMKLVSGAKNVGDHCPMGCFRTLKVIGDHCPMGCFRTLQVIMHAKMLSPNWPTGRSQWASPGKTVIMTVYLVMIRQRW